MNKLFKFLGIGSAIGVVAYGVIKYKNDQKFKEKVDEVADKTMTKASNFVAEHPNLFIAGLFTATMVPAVIHAVNADARRREMMQQAYEDYRASSDYDDDEEHKYLIVDPDRYDVVPKEEPKEDKPKTQTGPLDKWFSNWKEDYRDNWDEVNELAKRMSLAPGETFVIEEPHQHGLDIDNPIISHLINGEGCYPPETKDDQFID